MGDIRNDIDGSTAWRNRKFSNGLNDAQGERLALLLEEMGEAQQVIGKILRHGYESYHPRFPEKTNRQDLEKELGHVMLTVQMMIKKGDLIEKEILDYRLDKSLSIGDYLHHQEGPQ